MIPRTRVNFTLAELFRAVPGRNTSGKWCEHLAGLISKQFGTEPLLTGSGRGALYQLLSVLPQNRVVVSSYTCNAVAEAVSLAGKTLKVVDVPVGCYNTRAAEIAQLLDEESIVIATHQFGFPCDIEELVSLSHDAGAFVIEDCAAALGTRVNGRLVGTFGDAAFFSFDCSKLVTVPMKAGFLLVDCDDLRDDVSRSMQAATGPMSMWNKVRTLVKAMILRAVGMPILYTLFHMAYFRLAGRVTLESGHVLDRLGEFYNHCMADWQARIALPQFERLDALVTRRRELYAALREGLVDSGVGIPPEDIDGVWAPIRFPILVHGDKNAFYRRMNARGIDCAFSFTHLAPGTGLPNAQAIADHVLDLPFYDALSDHECSLVIEAVKGVVMEQSS